MKPSDYIRKGWCQEEEAFDRDGMPADATSDSACKWCLWGAFRASGNGDVNETDWVKLRLHLHDEPISWNDTTGRTQAEVITALEAVGL